jgi:hypothetical protein
MKRWTPYLSVLLVLALVGFAAACPMCKDSLANTKADGDNASLFAGGGFGVSGGFNTSIYAMILGFFTALGVVVFNIVRAIRK